MRVREWVGADYYRELGVAPSATRDEITAAYRARARTLHPDTGVSDPAAEAEFVRLAVAYRVLSGPRREDYDRARRRGETTVRPATPAGARAVGRASAPAPSRPWQLSRRGGRLALVGGLALVVAGIVAAVVVVMLQARDARLRDRGVAAQAEVVREDGVPRLEYATRAGAVVRADLPDPKSGGIGEGDVVEVRYDPDEPTRLVTAAGSVGRDITLWIMAAKLLVVGAVLAVIGARRLLRRDDEEHRSGPRPARAPAAAGPGSGAAGTGGVGAGAGVASARAGRTA